MLFETVGDIGGKYDDYDWDELPEEAKQAALTLGYTKEIWDADGDPATEDKYWKDLTPKEKEAAVLLGYDQEAWDKDDDE